MKSYKYLWEKYISEDNVVLALTRASKGPTKKKKRIRRISAHLSKHLDWILEYAANFCNCIHNPIEIYDGISRKKRKIIVPKTKEQIVHHMITNILIPIFRKGMYEHSYGSIPKRGAHKAKKTIEKWIKKDVRNAKYCLKMDIKKFFDSIPHDILKVMFAKVIHDKRFLNTIYTLIDVVDRGIPLGFYPSQWIANWYLQGLDHYIKEHLYSPHYARYVDDMVIFGSNKRKLHDTRKKISQYLKEKLGLEMKKNWQVFRFDHKKKGKRKGRALDFLGFKFYRDKTTLRKSIMLKASRKARKISKKERKTIYDVRQMLSYLGWIDCTDTYNMYKKHIKPFIKFGECKKQVSKYDHAYNLFKKEEALNAA